MTAPDPVRDRGEVLDVLARFVHGIDTRDWALYRSVFADVVEIDYSSYRPDSVGPVAADEWVARATRLFPGLTASQHLVASSYVQLAGDTATVRSSVRADHVLDGEHFVLGGSYVHRLTRGEGGWRIDGVALHVAWQDGDRNVLVRAAQRATT